MLADDMDVFQPLYVYPSSRNRCKDRGHLDRADEISECIKHFKVVKWHWRWTSCCPFHCGYRLWLVHHNYSATSLAANCPDNNRLSTPLQRLQSTQRKAGGIRCWILCQCNQWQLRVRRQQVLVFSSVWWHGDETWPCKCHLSFNSKYIFIACPQKYFVLD